MYFKNTKTLAYIGARIYVYTCVCMCVSVCACVRMCCVMCIIYCKAAQAVAHIGIFHIAINRAKISEFLHE